MFLRASVVLGCLLVTFHQQGRASKGKELPGSVRALMGAWKQEKTAKTNLIRFEPERFSRFVEGGLSFQRVAYQPGKEKGTVKVLRKVLTAREPFVTLSVRGDVLTVDTPAGPRTFRRLPKVPAELEVGLVPVAKPRPLPEAKVKAIRKELARRERLNIAVRLELRKLTKREERDAKTREMWKIDAGDTEYLLGLLKEVGWIDSKRFGDEAQHSAYLIVMHTLNFALMRTGVEELRKEVRAGTFDAEMWAGLHDRYRLGTARRERFGLHVFPDAKGMLCVGPLEDRAKVDQFRKEIGLPPLKEYLARHKEANRGKDVRVLEDD